MKNATVIYMSDQALTSLLMATIESYVVKNENMAKPQNRLETYGIFFGSETKTSDGSRVIRIDMANPSNTVRQTRESVQSSPNSLIVKADLVQSCFPHLSFLGDFHTHPYLHFSEVKKCRGYYLSETDRQAMTSDSKLYRKLGYRLGMVATIAYAERAGQNRAGYPTKYKNRVELVIGHFRIWLTAYVTRSRIKDGLFYSDDESSDVILHVPCMTGLAQFSAMGGVKFNKRGLTYESPLKDKRGGF